MTIGEQGEPVTFIPTYAGTLTGEGLLIAGFPGSGYTKRGYDTFFLDTDGKITPFRKYASYADLYDTRTCYTGGYLYVWGTSYFNGDGSIGHLVWTRTGSSDPADSTAPAEKPDMEKGMMAGGIIGLCTVGVLALLLLLRSKPAK